LKKPKEVIVHGIYLSKYDITNILSEIERIFNNFILEGKSSSEIVEELLVYYQNPKNRHYQKPKYITWFAEYLQENKQINEGSAQFRKSWTMLDKFHSRKVQKFAFLDV